MEFTGFISPFTRHVHYANKNLASIVTSYIRHVYNTKFTNGEVVVVTIILVTNWTL